MQVEDHLPGVVAQRRLVEDLAGDGLAYTRDGEREVTAD
jgi:hypothetical protein